ncbi:MAG: DUF2950 domain-containing protein [Reyranella sp.]|uniref:DUF2950 domain-containing protein n=1 Tax=Reyranella sp. TaxID=1929291 RepID=UPI003D0F810D
MSVTMMRRIFLALALVAGFAASAAAQPAPPRPQGFPTAEAAADALTAAVRSGDRAAIGKLWGADWRALVPLSDEDMERRRNAFIAAWDAGHKIVMSGDNKATIEIGRAGWTLPIPLVKDGAEWRFDIAAGLKQIALRRIGYNELSVVQTLLAIVDAQYDYAALDPMKTGAPVYARRLLSSPGSKDGLYWETKPGEPQSPLGPAVARAQVDGRSPDGHYGYYFRLLYAQGPDAPDGARDYIVGGRMIGGFGAIAWPVRYGVTGIMTFIVGYNGVVYQRDLGPDTAQKAAMITVFNPDKGWDKANMSPP